MYGSNRPGLNHYWVEQSYNTANILGSSVAGPTWYTLPNPRSYYVYNGALDFDRAADDCTGVADADVNFTQYVGINLMFNSDLDGYAWGGSSYMTLDGVSKLFSMTWEPPWGYADITVIAHEMGHGFGLPHSSGNYGAVYDNPYDVMSDGWSFCNLADDTTYGCLGQHTITYHKNSLGWIPAAQRYTVVDGAPAATITMEQLALPQTNNYRMAIIPLESSSHYYTVEVRNQAGYDAKLPGASAVVIHEVKTNRREPAHVVDADNNGNNKDGGTAWTVGETFNDAVNNVVVSVVSQTTSGYVVTLRKGGGSSEADLALTNNGTPDPVTLGSNLTYTLVATNNGPAAATNVKIVDTLPAGVSFVSAATGCTNASGTVTCTIGPLANGANSSKTIVVKVNSGSSVSSTASVSASETDPNAANNTAVANNSVISPSIDLSLTKTSSTSAVLVGTNFDYTLTAKNNGAQGATSVQIIDTLPAGVTFVSAAAGCTNASGTVTCNIGNLAAGASVSKKITVKPTATGTPVNTATVSAAQSDPNPSNNSATASVTVNPAMADLALTKTSSASAVLVGSDFKYTLTVTNNGPQPATNVQIVDTLPVGVTFVSAESGCTNASGTVTCTNAKLTSGASWSRKITVKPVATGTLTNTATVSAVESDPSTANNAATATTTVNAPAADLILSKTASATGKQGVNLSYVLTVKNNGPQPATNVQIVDTLPAGVTFVSADAGCANAEGTVTCTNAKLNAGASWTRRITVKPGAPGTLTNNATVGAAETDPNTANNAATATTTVN